VDGLYQQQLKGTDSVALSRSSNVVSALTLDHYFEYLGGMTMAIRDTTGRSPETYVSDVRDAVRASMLTAEQALRNDMRTKYWNPKWIIALQQEGFSGAAEISETTKNLFGWQVTKPEAIGDDVWDTVERIYVQDSLKLGMREWFDASNPYAYQSMTATMLEAARKGYWKASQEQLARVSTEYARSVAKHGPAGDIRTTGNEQFQQYLSRQLQAPGNIEGGLLLSRYRTAVERASGSGRLVVAGQRLMKQMSYESTQHAVRYSLLTLVSLCGVAALFYLGWKRRTRA
jgi:cobaltochelatase CobN